MRWLVLPRIGMVGLRSARANNGLIKPLEADDGMTLLGVVGSRWADPIKNGSDAAIHSKNGLDGAVDRQLV